MPERGKTSGLKGVPMTILMWLLLILLVLAVIYALGPRADRSWTMPNVSVPKDTENLEAYLKESERGYPTKPGLEKQILWAHNDKRKTKISLVFLHGYTASNLELNPVIRDLARELEANIFFTRYAGHGLSDDGTALNEATFNDWVKDTAEALEIGKIIGGKSLVISSSTGGSMAMWGAQHMPEKMDGLLFSSPNFKINHPLSFMLTLPWARQITKLVEPERRAWAVEDWWSEAEWELARNSGTMEQYTTSALPVSVAALQARRAQFEDIKVPALFLIDPKDGTVVANETTEKAYPRWGAEIKELAIIESDHSSHHVIAGTLTSPRTNKDFIDACLAFVARLGA